MALTKTQKLKKVLWDLSTPEEKAELDFLEKQKDSEVFGEKLDEMASVIEKSGSENKKGLENSFNSLVKAFGQYSTQQSKKHEEFVGELADKFNKLTGTITTSYEKNKPFNASGVYKDMINQLSAINESVQNKPVPVWNWPQYASVGVRNKNFENINPSVDGFNIGDYDDLTLGYTGSNLTSVTYFLNGLQTAVLTLSYSGSNLIEVKRTA